MGRRGVEEHREVGIRERRVEIGAPFIEAMCCRDLRKTAGIAPDQQRTRHDAIIADNEPALATDRHQRVGEMLGRGLIRPGRAAVDDDADGNWSDMGYSNGEVAASSPAARERSM